MNTIHLIEPTGHGGIFQHTGRLGQILVEGGVDVTIHTTASHEPVDLPGVRLCYCSPWRRRGTRPGLVSISMTVRYCCRTVPHLVCAVRDGEIAHVQGLPFASLTSLTVLALRAAGRPTVVSPHNTFSRRGSRLGLGLIKMCTRRARTNLAFSQHDVDTLRSWGASSLLSPLVQLVPEPEPERIESWRQAWDARDGDHVVLFAGQIRPDKRLDVLVKSAAAWPEDRKLAVVGEDRGHWKTCRNLAARQGVHLHATVGFVPLEDFIAAIAAADVVVLPHERASQSGVLVLARELGVPTVASRVGGLDELSSESVPSRDAAALTSAIDAAIKSKRQHPEPLDSDRARDVHLQAYRWALESRPKPASGRSRVTRSNVAFLAWTRVRARPHEFAAALDAEAAAFFDLGISWRPLVPLRYLSSAVRTMTRLALQRPDAIIVTNPPIFPALIAYAYSRIVPARLILDSHPSSFGKKDSELARAMLPVHAWVARKAMTTIVGGEEFAAIVRSWGARADVIHEAPPLWTVKPCAPLGHERPRVLLLGVLARDEPVSEVLEAARLLPNFRFEVTGNPARIPSGLRRRAPDNVLFTGFIEGSDFVRALEDAHIVLALTTEPGSAMRAACEAVYGGRPLVLSDWPNLGRMFPYAVPVRNEAESIATGLRRAVECHDELRDVAERAREQQLERWHQQLALLRQRLSPDDRGGITSPPRQQAREREVL